MGSKRPVWIVIAAVLGSALAWAEAPSSHFGLLWGQSRQEALDAADAVVLSRALHQRYGEAFEVDKLPVAIGGEIHRILYFDDKDKLLRVWIDFGHPEGRVWKENYLLDEAIVKYRSLKDAYHLAGKACLEPELVLVEEEGRKILERSFGRNRTVWACEDERGPTRLKISLRRLGDIEGQRFDVIYDAQDRRAVADYRSLHQFDGSN